jgi:prepilin-type N-terminal cleavage/methylation domain-containing protein
MNSPFKVARKNRKNPRAFTLIELLVVICIIAILVGLLIPAITGALNSAKKTTAKNQAVTIAGAISAYESEYGRLPSNGSSTNFGPALVNILCTSNDATNNPRGIVFLDAQAWRSGKGGTNANGFCDPFNANNPYSVAMDTTYAGSLPGMPSQSNSGGTITYTTTLTKDVGVWTVWTNGSRTYLIDSWE